MTKLFSFAYNKDKRYIMSIHEVKSLLRALKHSNNKRLYNEISNFVMDALNIPEERFEHWLKKFYFKKVNGEP